MTDAVRLQPPRRRRWLVALGLDVRPGEGRLTALLFTAFFVVITFQYLVKTVRQATFVDTVGAANLPWVYLLVSVLSWPVLTVSLRVSPRLTRDRLMAGTCLLVAASLGIFSWIARFDWSWIPFVFYVWVSLVFVTLVSQFWMLTHHLLDVRQARRLFGVIGAGGLLGGIAGGQAARLAGTLLGTRQTLLVAAGLLLGLVALVILIDRSAPAATEVVGERRMPDDAVRRPPERVWGSVGEVWRSHHLRLVAVALVVSVVAAQVIDLQFNWAVEVATSGLRQRTAVFGNLFSIAGAAAFLFQILFTARLYKVLGVGFAARVLPVVVVLGGSIVLIISGLLPEGLLTAIFILKVADSGMRYSLDQSTRELLFLPVPADLRGRAKATIDLLLQRAAKGIGAVILMPVAFGWLTPVAVGWLTPGLGILWLMTVSRAYREYVRSFRAGLKERTVDTAVPINLNDVRTVELLVQSLGSSDTRQVLHGLDILAANGRGGLVPPLLLYHDDARVRRRTLQVLAGVGRRDATELVERRLGDEHPDVRAEAIRVLTGFNRGGACALMRPRLDEADPRVRAAAVTCLASHGDEEDRQRARATLQDMLSDARSSQRAEAVKAMGAIPGPAFEAQLIRSLDDREPEVAQEAIGAVRRIVSREGFVAIYLPRLVAHLQNRRLKQDAREALIEFGTDAVPILVHFMNEPEESIFVRRALPRVLARIGGPAAVQALTGALLTADDGFLRAQIVDALALCRADIATLSLGSTIEAAIEAEARRTLSRLADVPFLARSGVSGLEGPVLRCDRRELDLLTQMIAERLEDHVRTLFGMLALLAEPPDIWAAWRSLVSSRPAWRTHALEYLENTLSADLRRSVFAVIDEAPLPEKLERATRLFGIRSISRTESMERILGGVTHGNSDASALAVAALYTIYTEEMTDLYPRVKDLAAGGTDPLVHETATWVASRLAVS